MIIEDDHGTILVDPKDRNVIIDQHGNKWHLTDERDGLGVELILTGQHAEIAAVPMAQHAFKIKATLLGRRNGH
jgi:hypothetical protein